MDETRIVPANHEAPALNPKVPEALRYDAYYKAGGFLKKDEYTKVIDAGTGAMNGEAKELLAVHMKQAEVLAKNAGLPPDLAQPAAIYYAVLREAKKYGLNPDLVPTSDQEVFAQALLITQGEAYRDYISKFPHIFNARK